MHRNKVWLFFLSAVVFMMFGFVVHATGKVLQYRHLSLQVPATITTWEIQEGKRQAYSVTARYFFEFQGRTYSGTSSVTSPYKNPWAAQKAVSGFEQRTWQVWVNPQQPIHSTLYKAFPTKIVLSAAVLTALVVYFSVIGTIAGGYYGRRAR